MEEDIRKQGILYLQQQRFGKKWKRMWCVLFRESSCSISRLEFFDCKDGGSSDKTHRKQQENKKVIRMASCIRVSEVESDGCPRDSGAFVVETTEKIYMFAAERNQLEDWTQRLCELAFPMNWTDPGVKRGSLHRSNPVDEDEGMEDNSLYSGRESVRDFRVCVRRTEASDRCRLKGEAVLRADDTALLLVDRSGDITFSWPYRYLRRFGRDKTSFSFEAGRRCASGEGSFEFDTRQGNLVFQAVEAAINLQRTSLPPHRQASTQATAQGSPDDHSMTLPQPRNLTMPPTGKEVDCVYSMVTEAPTLLIHSRDKDSSAPHRHPACRLEPPVDKMLTAVKSLNLDSRSVPRKNQVKMISSCPLPQQGPETETHTHTLSQAHTPSHTLLQTHTPSHTLLQTHTQTHTLLQTHTQTHTHTHAQLSPKLSANQTYSKVTLPAERRSRREKRSSEDKDKDPEYSLPFDTLAVTGLADILSSQQTAPLYDMSSQQADPLYDSIDEMKIRNVFPSNDSDGDVTKATTFEKVEHIYDEPEGCAAPPSVYDDPEEMRGDAWKIMGTPADPKGHEFPYNPRVDDYAVPKRPQRLLPVSNTNEEEGEQEGEEPYNNVMVKMA